MQDAIPEEEEIEELLLVSKSLNKGVATIKETPPSAQIKKGTSPNDSVDDCDLGFSYVSTSQRSIIPRKGTLPSYIAGASNDTPALAVASSKHIKHTTGDEWETKNDAVMDADDLGELPDDTDYPNDKKEYEAWKERFVRRKQQFYGSTENKGEMSV
ncbi:unnamed protein product [Phytomonas sp. EM1]|nr:unnamed protein product [Phytomonas sp. EM1]|eukprot:CCW64863.1 unnamed protein product [Phytomonas sp. isolate EM1]